MAEYLIQGETLTGIADAIRAKTGGTAAIKPGDMAAEIRTIEAGGGGGGNVSIDFLAVQISEWGDVNIWPFKAGMTWEEFYNSQYATPMFSLNGVTDLIEMYFNYVDPSDPDYDHPDGWSYSLPEFTLIDGKTVVSRRNASFAPAVNSSDVIRGFFSEGHIYTLESYR